MNSLPEKLNRALSQSHEAMLQHPKHDLNLGYRHLIWAEFGISKSLSNQDALIGHKRRTYLAIFSAKHVLPIWNKFYVNNDLSYRSLNLAEKTLNKTIDEETAWKERNMHWERLLEMGNLEEKYQNVHGAGFSAVQALTTSLRDEIFDPSKINLELTDADIDPEEMDASFFASAAQANGAVWDSNSDSLKRKEFWEWWIREAVPNSWKLNFKSY